MLPSDKPTVLDAFGFQPYVKGIESIIRETTADDLPLSIGIYGSWGSGKSSFMMQLRSSLQASDEGLPIPCIWFDAWKYDRIADTRNALIYKILLGMKKQSDEGFSQTIKSMLDKYASVFRAFAFQSRLTIGVPGIGIQMASVQEAANATADDAESFQTEVDGFSETFRDVVQEFLRTTGRPDEGKLVVFIDDLDRCLPENVILSLEALKLFLDEAPCVFVLGLDRNIVEGAIQNHYEITPGDTGRDYLDKIIRVPFVIPPIRPERLQAHFKAYVGEFDDQCWAIIEVASRGNPRLYSRFVGSWKVIAALGRNVGLDLASDSVRKMLVVAIAVLLRFPRLHEMGMSFPAEFKYFYLRCQDGAWDIEGGGDEGMAAKTFHTFWEDIPTRAFFRELRVQLGLYADENPLEGDVGSIETAFRLTSSTI